MVVRRGRQALDQPAMQAGLFHGAGAIQTLLISHRKDFESLFDGFKSMHAVSYVVSSYLLLEFFRQRGYDRIEVVVGQDLKEPGLRQELRDKPAGLVDDLAMHVETGSLRILIPRRTIHTKLYLLERPGEVRIIQTSANLTETAQRASQVNYAWYVDLAPEDDFAELVRQDYAAHARGCALFMGDLLELFKQQGETPRHELIDAWVKGEAAPPPEAEAAKVLQHLSAQVLLGPAEQDAGIVTVTLPEAPAAKRELERSLSLLHPTVSGSHLSVSPTVYLNHVHKTYGIPLMRPDLENGVLRLGFGGSVVHLSEPVPGPAIVNDSLQHLEDYVNTIDLGKSPEPGFAKAGMFEAILYIFFAPFANEYMRMKRMAYGQVDPRGPRYLYIYGPTQNGKTTFLRFVLKLLTGHDTEPLSRDEFTRKRIRGAAEIGTVFPLLFDDVEFSGKSWVPDVLKPYWENWWRGDLLVPQLVISSNEPRLQDWAKSRVKRVDFDVHFSSTEHGKRTLKELFDQENRLFHWFSHMYLRHLVTDGSFGDDELYLARTVMGELYYHAGRQRPRFFLARPVEEEYDLGSNRWADLLYNRREARLERERERLLVRFPDKTQWWEVRRYEGYLPSSVKARQESNTIIIETPREFDAWCPAPHRRLWPFGRR